MLGKWLGKLIAKKHISDEGVVGNFQNVFTEIYQYFMILNVLVHQVSIKKKNHLFIDLIMYILVVLHIYLFHFHSSKYDRTDIRIFRT